MESVIKFLEENLLFTNHKTLLAKNDFGIFFLKTVFDGQGLVGKSLYIPFTRNNDLEHDLTCQDIVCVDEDFTTNERALALIDMYCDATNCYEKQEDKTSVK
jgi:hypothetical protein